MTVTVKVVVVFEDEPPLFPLLLADKPEPDAGGMLCDSSDWRESERLNRRDA